MSTIPQALDAVAACGRGRLDFHLDGATVALSSTELGERAIRAAGVLAARGVGPGARVGLFGPNRPEWAVWAHAVWMTGAALVPLQIPIRVRDAEALRLRVAALVEKAGCTLVVSDPALAFAVDPDRVLGWEEPAAAAPGALAPPQPGDPAVIQFTSGSTAEPKGVVLSHAAVVAQMDAITERTAGKAETTTVVGWAPFFHDLGLFMYLLGPVLCGATVRILPTEQFARDPAAWLRATPREGNCALIGPQSAWSAAFRARRRRPDEPVDLRAVDAAWFAAESIDPAFVDRMVVEGAAVGLREDALGATYGLAEFVLGVTSTRRGAGLRIEVIDGRRVVSCGVPMGDAQVRIADGEIQVRGASLMSGYLDAPSPIVDGWLRTGDLGHVRDGELYVTGRAKDVLIVLGHNHHPEDFEWAAGRVEGVRPGRCVAFLDAARDRLTLLVEPSGTVPPERLASAVRRAAADAVGVAPAEVAVVPPGTIEKTTSGKLRRTAMRERHSAGQVEVLSSTAAR